MTTTQFRIDLFFSVLPPLQHPNESRRAQTTGSGKVSRPALKQQGDKTRACDPGLSVKSLCTLTLFEPV